MKTYRIDRREIHFLKFILEAYEGAASITTLDAINGVVAINVAPGRGKEVDAVLDALASSVMIESVETESTALTGKTLNGVLVD